MGALRAALVLTVVLSCSCASPSQRATTDEVSGAAPAAPVQRQGEAANERIGLEDKAAPSISAAPGIDPPAEPALRAELLRMSEVAQQERRRLVEAMKPGHQIDPASAAKLEAIDAANTRRIAQIIDEHGWPGPRLVGRDGASAAFLLLQHADGDRQLQARALPLLRDAVAAGDATGQQLALLTDRVRIAEGRPQLFGTQAKLVDGVIVFYPIADEASVDERRAELGLPSMAEYELLLKQAYGLADEP